MSKFLRQEMLVNDRHRSPYNSPSECVPTFQKLTKMLRGEQSGDDEEQEFDEKEAELERLRKELLRERRREERRKDQERWEEEFKMEQLRRKIAREREERAEEFRIKEEQIKRERELREAQMKKRQNRMDAVRKSTSSYFTTSFTSYGSYSSYAQDNQSENNDFSYSSNLASKWGSVGEDIRDCDEDLTSSSQNSFDVSDSGTGESTASETDIHRSRYRSHATPDSKQTLPEKRFSWYQRAQSVPDYFNKPSNDDEEDSNINENNSRGQKSDHLRTKTGAPSRHWSNSASPYNFSTFFPYFASRKTDLVDESGMPGRSSPSYVEKPNSRSTGNMDDNSVPTAERTETDPDKNGTDHEWNASDYLRETERRKKAREEEERREAERREEEKQKLERQKQQQRERQKLLERQQWEENFSIFVKRYQNSIEDTHRKLCERFSDQIIKPDITAFRYGFYEGFKIANESKNRNSSRNPT